MITSYIMLDNVEYGVPSGNYDGSSQDFASDAVKGPGYYLGHPGQQTVTFRFSNFTGRITLQATLDSEAGTADWVDVYDFTNTDVTSYFSIDRTANFVWLRVRVQDFDAGTIDLIDIAYP